LVGQGGFGKVYKVTVFILTKMEPW
jgi:hypothetical protein